MCFKEVKSYMMCGCLDNVSYAPSQYSVIPMLTDKVAHIRTCTDRLLKDDFGHGYGYGYSRCPVAEHDLTNPEATLPGYCPRCAVNNLVVVNDKLVPMSGIMKKMTPLTRLPPKEKKEEVKKDKDGKAS